MTAGLCSHPLQGGIPVPHAQLTLGFTGAPQKIRTSRNRKIRILIPIYVYMGCPLIPCKDRKDKGVFYKLVNYILFKGCLPDFVFLLRTSAIFKQAWYCYRFVVGLASPLAAPSLGRFSTSRTASFCFSSTYIARYVHTWKTKIYCTIGKKSPQANL